MYREPALSKCLLKFQNACKLSKQVRPIGFTNILNFQPSQCSFSYSQQVMARCDTECEAVCIMTNKAICIGQAEMMHELYHITKQTIRISCDGVDK